MSAPKVYIVSSDNTTKRMFKDHGWEISDSIKDADLVQFTGGSDVSPSLYGHTVHSSTQNSPIRDKREAIIFNLCIALNKPMVGICRGGQFLNVMCGGKMFQDVDGHCGRNKYTHDCRDIKTGEVFTVTSTHHQMMCPATDAVILGIACESTKRDMHINGKVVQQTGLSIDKEIVFYKDQNCLCFQPHPEFSIGNDLAKRYFQYIDEYLFKLPVETH